MNPLLSLTLAASLVISVEAGEALHEPRRLVPDMPAQIARLRAEISALVAKVRGDSPEFQDELRAWEAKMSEPAEWSPHEPAPRAAPARIAGILALEPSERTAAQRTALADYFRSRSKVVANARRAAAMKRAELARLPK